MMMAAQKAAKRLLRDFGEVEQLQVSVKGPSDFVSQADLRAEETLKAELGKGRPEFAFLMEETGASGPDPWKFRWVVDPLDGTTNFLHGIPHFSISIALEREGTIVAGLIYKPIGDELFLAERGKGAFLNDQRIRVAARKTMTEAVVACGLPHHGRGGLELFRQEFAQVQDRVAGLRRFGSAALDLAYVAAGRLDIYWERNISPWDIAAGAILVREAGGYVSDLDGNDAMFAKGHVIAGNETLHRELLQALKQAAKGEALKG